MSDAQLADIRRLFRSRKIPYHISSGHPHWRYLCVRATDWERARQLVSEERQSYAVAQREKWERDWREKYQGSYWKWLTHQGAVRAKMAALRLLLLV